MLCFLRLGVLWESTGERETHLGIPGRLLGGGHTEADSETGIWNAETSVSSGFCHRLG